MEAIRIIEGIPVVDSVVEEISALAQKLGVSAPVSMANK
jgi:hypothetical protein